MAHRWHLWVTSMIRSAYMLSSVLQSARKKAGLSQAQLAQIVGVSRKTIGEIENGQIEKVAVGTIFKTLKGVGLHVNVEETLKPMAKDVEQMSYDRRFRARP